MIWWCADVCLLAASVHAAFMLPGQLLGMAMGHAAPLIRAEAGAVQ